MTEENLVTIDLDLLYEAVVRRVTAGAATPKTKEEAVAELHEIFAEVYPDLPPPPEEICGHIYGLLAIKAIDTQMHRLSCQRPEGVTLQ